MYYNNPIEAAAVVFFGSGSGISEVDNFWPHLQMSGFNYQNKTFANMMPAGGFDIDSSTPNSPKISLDVDSGILPLSASSCAITGTTLPCYAFGAWRNEEMAPGWGIVQIYNGTPALKPASALAIDQKIDDSKATTGNIIATTNSGTCFSGTDYVASNSNVVCNMYVQLLSQVGQKQ